MTESNLNIPLDLLDPRLKDIIPAEEEVLYTSRCKVFKPGVAQGNTYGDLAITNKAIVFVAKKSGFAGGFASAGGHKDYIAFKDIVKFKNNKKQISVKFIIPEDPKRKKKRGYKISIERCKDIDEDKLAFKQRKNLFGDFVENLMSGSS